MSTCRENGCNRPSYCKGLCSAHYQRGKWTKRKRREREVDAEKERENRWRRDMLSQWPAMEARDAQMSGEGL